MRGHYVPRVAGILLATIVPICFAQSISEKVAVRIACVCDDTLSNRLIESLVDGLNASAKYTEAPSHTSFTWKVSVDTVVIDEQNAIAVSIAVTRNNLLVDQWASFCKSTTLDTCSQTSLKAVIRTIDISTATSDPETTVASTPPPPPSKHHTGDNLSPPVGPVGNGELTLQCFSDTYSEVRVINSNSKTQTPVRHQFVGPKQGLTISDIAPGSYWVKVAQARYFDDQTNQLVDPTEYFMFPHPYTFTETDRGDHIEYHKVTLTLSKVPDGNVTPISISKEEFMSNKTPSVP